MAIQINKIESAIMEFPNGSKVPIGRYINLPMAWESVLDETHGTAKILMTDMRQTDFDQYNIRIDKPFNVNVPIEIKFEGQGTIIRMIVARDTAEMVRKDGFPAWSHNVEFVDEVKNLEQEPVDNLTFRNPIPRRYDENASSSWSMIKSDGHEAVINNSTGWIKPTAFKCLYEEGAVISFSDNASTWDYGNGLQSTRMLEYIKFRLITPSGWCRVFNNPTESTGVAGTNLEYISNTYSFSATEIGEYRIEVEVKWYYAKAQWHYTTYALYFFVGAQDDIPTAHTVKSVIDRILDVTPTRTANGANKYSFRNSAREYATEESPEFTFTGKHLFEVMLDIASYKKMFPALYKNEIYFRPFWNGVMLTSDDLPPPTKAILCSAIDQYCTAIDSYVENMVCINDTNVGTVVEPYAGGYVSARSNNGSAISETTAIIPTQSAIYQPLMLNVGETDGIDVGDIQAYLYEQEDYEALSDTAAAYPYSKGYALKYTRFSKDYTELSHRIKTSSSLADALTKPALANIIGAATNGRVGNTGVNLRTYLSQFIGIGDDDSDGVTHFAKLLFQPTYIPVVNARVRQYKPMFSEDDYQATIFYNQQSEVVDSEAFGEHVKGLVQKLGNHTEIRVYRFAKIDEVPTVGTLIDEKSVYNVAMTIYENHVDATICLVDHAELSTYIGVKNEIKTSDISTTKWCNRFINWEEFLVFTHEAHTGNALSITKEALADIVSFTVAEPLTCAMFTSYGENEDTIIEAFAPIKHLALGNSIYFQWEMLDNFAVGYTSEEAPDNATSAWSGTQYDRAQRAVRYCDSFGRMEKLDFQLIKTGPTVDNSLISVPHVTYDVNAGLCTVTLDVVMDVHVDCWILVETVHTDGSTTEYTVTHSFAPGESVYVLLLGANMVKDCGARVATATSEQKWTYTRALAHAYPKKHDNLVFNPIPSFRLYDLLVKKNSAEALKFAAQYHFRQDWREFVIGSGMSNFCSLVGGSCTQLQMFTSGLPINRFERHINFGDTYNYRILNELPTFTVDEENLRVIIRLPSSVNDYINATKSWGLVGTDRNGNRQLIFGENKNAKNEEFLRTIYLVPRQKNNEPQARATYTLTRTQSSSSVGCWVYIDEDLTGGIAYGSSMEIHRQASVKIWNSHSAGVNLTISKVKNHIDGTKEIISTEIFYIPYRGSYSFTMSSDMEFNVWTTHVSGGTSTPV